MPSPSGRTPTTLRALPRAVLVLGTGSLLMDLSSEMIHSLLPLFLVTALGVSALSVGAIEGVAEATASVSRVFSGVLSDRIGRRKPLVVLGYGLAALTKPIFPLASSVSAVFAARFIDRVGKGIRGAPRDALIADLTPAALRGAAYGLRQSLDTVGALLAPLAAMALMTATGDDFRLVFWVAVAPAFLAVALLALGVHEPRTTRPAARPSAHLKPAEARRLGGRYWQIVAAAAVLTLARFSEAFLLLRAQDLGLAVSRVPLVLVAMNLVYAASGYPMGRLSDLGRRRALLAFGIACLVVADLVLAAATAIWQVMAGAMLWGLHMGATQGVLAAMVADAAPADLRGTAFGIFHLTAGAALLAASVLAGLLWTTYGPAAAFLAGAAFAGLALLGLLGRPA